MNYIEIIPSCGIKIRRRDQWLKNFQKNHYTEILKIFKIPKKYKIISSEANEEQITNSPPEIVFAADFELLLLSYVQEWKIRYNCKCESCKCKICIMKKVQSLVYFVAWRNHVHTRGTKINERVLNGWESSKKNMSM